MSRMLCGFGAAARATSVEGDAFDFVQKFPTLCVRQLQDRVAKLFQREFDGSHCCALTRSTIDS